MFNFAKTKARFSLELLNLKKSSSRSRLYHFSKKEFQNILDKDLIYESNSNDIGHFDCKFNANKIYFLKNFSKSSFPVSELVELVPETKEITQLTESKYTNSFFSLGDRMFVMINGEQRLILGKASLLDDAIPTKETGSSRSRGIKK